jgi:hypothetical protein
MDRETTTAQRAGMAGSMPNGGVTGTAGVTRAMVWRALKKASFAVVSHVCPAGEPRSSGVVYGVADGRLYMVAAADSWKARQIVTGQRVAVTVPLRRGGLLALFVPIPPATISFEAQATVHAPDSFDLAAIPARLARLLPEARRTRACVIELVPEGRFLTYGLGVPLKDLRDPVRARARVPVA